MVGKNVAQKTQQDQAQRELDDMVSQLEKKLGRARLKKLADFAQHNNQLPAEAFVHDALAFYVASFDFHQIMKMDAQTIEDHLIIGPMTDLIDSGAWDPKKSKTVQAMTTSSRKQG